VYQTYNDMDLRTIPDSSVKIGRTATGGVGAAKPRSHLALWLAICAILALAASGAIVAYAKRATAGKEGGTRARDVFKMPSEVDGFSVIALLRKLRSSPLVHLQEPQRQELQQDLQRVQQACFGADNGELSESHLREVAEKWLRIAC
jgi:hypothetical protein